MLIDLRSYISVYLYVLVHYLTTVYTLYYAHACMVSYNICVVIIDTLTVAYLCCNAVSACGLSSRARVLQSATC